jgi:hypothetical protein
MMYPFMEWSIRTVESQLLVVLIPAMACDLASRYVICAKCDCLAREARRVMDKQNTLPYAPFLKMRRLTTLRCDPFTLFIFIAIH